VEIGKCIIDEKQSSRNQQATGRSNRNRNADKHAINFNRVASLISLFVVVVPAININRSDERPDNGSDRRLSFFYDKQTNKSKAQHKRRVEQSLMKAIRTTGLIDGL